MYLTANGVRVHYQTWGRGRPVVLLHGFPLSGAMWRPQGEGLSERWQVVAPDFRGFGASDPPTGAMTLEDYADDVLRVTDALGLSRFVLGGLSMGGYVVFRVLAKAAGRVDAVILADTRADPDTEEGRRRRFDGIARIEREGPEGFLADFTAALVGPTTRAHRTDVLEAVHSMACAAHPRGLTVALAAIAARPDSRPLLSGLAVPVLVVVGEEDTVTPPDAARAMAAAIPGARLVVVPGAGHLANLERPEAFTAAVREFLADLEARRT
ncbi:MAG: alpha/beta fold hydrolase [Armatimonadota bacterium]|nr:alpha/beta fold hydrolase [Armatimonadota bacterium]MDR7533551.1 alpha/beta fold hydrolase [Armatimonadota bacterium]MDR7536859.1 alpha/beta fold hydrolase [Armatimonadota bacterium]